MRPARLSLWGRRFDIKQLHEILGRGRMPLVVLERVVKTTLV